MVKFPALIAHPCRLGGSVARMVLVRPGRIVIEVEEYDAMLQPRWTPVNWQSFWGIHPAPSLSPGGMHEYLSGLPIAPAIRYRHRWGLSENWLHLALYHACGYKAAWKTDSAYAGLAGFLGRSTESSYMKICNFARHDPEYRSDGRVGLSSNWSEDKKDREAFHWLLWQAYALQPEMVLGILVPAAVHAITSLLHEAPSPLDAVLEQSSVAT